MVFVEPHDVLGDNWVADGEVGARDPVEVGGALSHAVVVARELGIPAVVSVEHCCDVLHTGDLIEVDGSTGVVRVLERKV